MIDEHAIHCSFCGKRVAVVVARRKLMRAREGRKIAGVCLGFAQFFDVDVTLIRVLWLIFGVITGVGILAYPIAWLLMPEQPLRLTALSSTEQKASST